MIHTTPHHLRRIVITGMGAITPLGSTLPLSFQNLSSSIGMTTLEEALHHQTLSPQTLSQEINLLKTLPCHVGAPVQNFPHDPRTIRVVQFVLQAGEEAMKQSRLADNLDDNLRDRIGTCIGVGMSSVREILEASKQLESKKLSPHFVPKVLTNSAAGRLSLRHRLRGPSLAPSTACAAGAHAIGDAMRIIQYGDADIMLAGGGEACIDSLSLAGFCRLRALSKNRNPEVASRPFDEKRDGFVMGEGAAVLVLEELEHAKRRGVDILAELRGYGLTGDGYHITAPDPEGNGAERAMRMALHHGHVDRHSVEYVNAHATSTPKGDEIEEKVIEAVLMTKDRDRNLFVSSTKGATGHLLGAAGAAEAAFSVMSLQTGKIPPTRNLIQKGQVGFEHVAGDWLEQKMDVVMSNSFGFGGTNASLVFSRYQDDDN